MQKTVLNYGLISGIIVSLWMSVTMLGFGCQGADNMEWGMALGFAGMIIAFAFIFVAIKNYRDKFNGGTVSFGKAFMIGLWISLIASSFYVVTWLVIYYNFMPDFMDKYAAKVIEQIQASGAPAAEIKEQIAEMEHSREQYKNPIFVMLYTYMEILPVGLLITIITALFLKKKPQHPLGA
ncbi:DUF4199 domain-containing protein [Flavobacterium sp.]|uniref:DUF4199 domain-containing protein n=1 Tax=Flavobacterium sp. TaxID=239 RepID=UPI0039E2B51A